MEQPYGLDALFGFVPLFIGLIFVLTFGVLAAMITKSISVNISNDQSPIVEEHSKIIAKRSSLIGSAFNGQAGSVHYRYFATFENDAGDRREFSMRGNQFGLLLDGDSGTLRYQGTRFLEFIRERTTGSG